MAHKAVFCLFFLSVMQLAHAQEYQTHANTTYILVDDLLLLPEQHSHLRERNFFTPNKWPKTGKEVIIPYYFDNYEIETLLAPLLSQAAAEYYRETCIKWVKVRRSDPGHKVRIFSGSRCHSNVGMVGEENQLSIGSGCKQIGIIMHEMGHTMGVFHTQSRPDRDDYIEVWPQNMEKAKLNNFLIQESNTYGVPYDYMSVMHYGGTSFSKNSKFTITAKHPFYQFSMGWRPLTLRYADKAILNFAYECSNGYSDTCSELKCQNGGYVNRRCKCTCPENTKGLWCEDIAVPYYSQLPECGGNITSPQIIQSDNFPSLSNKKRCIFWIKAPGCQVPKITLKFIKFYGQSCLFSMFAVKGQKGKLNDVYCSSEGLEVGKTFTADSTEAIVYYYSSFSGNQNYGFQATVEFVTDESCSMNH